MVAWEPSQLPEVLIYENLRPAHTHPFVLPGIVAEPFRRVARCASDSEPARTRLCAFNAINVQ
eukprot:1744974-Rhodomonas_salina.1